MALAGHGFFIDKTETGCKLMKPPFTEIDIETADSGFYKGYCLPVALVSKIGVTLLVIWALVWPGNASSNLGSLNTQILHVFNAFYIVAVGGFAVFLATIALIPSSGRRVLGTVGEAPEFSTFSWFSMMFGAGLGVGLMVYATAEPMRLWGSSPAVIAGAVAPYTEAAVESGFRYSFMHYGFHPWSIYVVTGLSLAYYSYSRNLPLTVRSALTPLFGKWLNGFLGHAVDILAVVATILGISVTIGYGVSQLVDGVYSITDVGWLVRIVDGRQPLPSTVGLIVALVIIMGLSTLSAVSGVDRGVKILSNINMLLSIVLLASFVVFGSFLFAATTYATALADYVIHFVPLSFQAFDTTTPLGGWQTSGTTFYWAWWIAFSPFVGLFLARISKGRTVREFVLGAVIAPSLVCFVWMTLLGGTAIDAELTGVAQGAIIDATTTNKLFANLGVMLGDGPLLSTLTAMCVVLIMTFLVTSADSGILVLNTIMSGGSTRAGIKHRIIWGILVTLVIGSLLVAGNSGGSAPLDSLTNAMIIGALPFTAVMVLMCVSLAKALYRDNMRDNVAVRSQGK